MRVALNLLLAFLVAAVTGGLAGWLVSEMGLGAPWVYIVAGVFGGAGLLVLGFILPHPR